MGKEEKLRLKEFQKAKLIFLSVEYKDSLHFKYSSIIYHFTIQYKLDINLLLMFYNINNFKEKE